MTYVLPFFSLIVATDEQGGIAKEGKIPWTCPDDLKLFRRLTIGRGLNAVIMGRKTYQSLPGSLPHRVNIVVSSNFTPPDEKVIVVSSLVEALRRARNVEEVFIIGGEQIYHEALEKFLYLCRTVHLTRIEGNYECDQFFPLKFFERIPGYRSSVSVLTPFAVYTKYDLSVDHPELSYLNLLRRILTDGEDRSDRTGVGTRSIFGATLEFDLSGKRVPFLTTKKVSTSSILKELFWMISGSTDAKILERQGVNIWKGNTSEEFLRKRGLPYREGDLGPGYGFQFRHWGAKYDGCDGKYDRQGIDQLSSVIEGIKTDPFGRRHLISLWNVAELEKMALPPCHLLSQFYVTTSKELDLQVYMRSCDTFLGLPYNLGFYGTLLHLVAHLCGLSGRNLRIIFGDVHIYSNHFSQVGEQLTRTPLPWATVEIKEKIMKIEDFNLENVMIKGYNSWPAIKGEMAV